MPQTTSKSSSSIHSATSLRIALSLDVASITACAVTCSHSTRSGWSIGSGIDSSGLYALGSWLLFFFCMDLLYDYFRPGIIFVQRPVEVHFLHLSIIQVNTLLHEVED